MGQNVSRNIKDSDLTELVFLFTIPLTSWRAIHNEIGSGKYSLTSVSLNKRGKRSDALLNISANQLYSTYI